MVLQVLTRISLKATLVAGTFAIGSGAALSQSKVFCLDQTVNHEKLNEIKGSFSKTVSSGLSAATYVKERAENTGIVRFGRAAAVVGCMILSHSNLLKHLMKILPFVNFFYLINVSNFSILAPE